MKLRVTENNKFLRLYEASETEFDQIKFSLKKRIRGWFFNPLVNFQTVSKENNVSV